MFGYVFSGVHLQIQLLKRKVNTNTATFVTPKLFQTPHIATCRMNSVPRRIQKIWPLSCLKRRKTTSGMPYAIKEKFQVSQVCTH